MAAGPSCDASAPAPEDPRGVAVGEARAAFTALPGGLGVHGAGPGTPRRAPREAKGLHLPKHVSREFPSASWNLSRPAPTPGGEGTETHTQPARPHCRGHHWVLRGSPVRREGQAWSRLGHLYRMRRGKPRGGTPGHRPGHPAACHSMRKQAGLEVATRVTHRQGGTAGRFCQGTGGRRVATAGAGEAARGGSGVAPTWTVAHGLWD